MTKKVILHSTLFDALREKANILNSIVELMSCNHNLRYAVVNILRTGITYAKLQGKNNIQEPEISKLAEWISKLEVT